MSHEPRSRQQEKCSHQQSEEQEKEGSQLLETPDPGVSQVGARQVESRQLQETPEPGLVGVNHVEAKYLQETSDLGQVAVSQVDHSQVRGHIDWLICCLETTIEGNSMSFEGNCFFWEIACLLIVI